eukprot:1160492-Pelagomonas_calceolata.AAC.15
MECPGDSIQQLLCVPAYECTCFSKAGRFFEVKAGGKCLKLDDVELLVPLLHSQKNELQGKRKDQDVVFCKPEIKRLELFTNKLVHDDELENKQILGSLGSLSGFLLSDPPAYFGIVMLCKPQLKRPKALWKDVPACVHWGCGALRARNETA